MMWVIKEGGAHMMQQIILELTVFMKYYYLILHFYRIYNILNIIVVHTPRIEFITLAS